jgi:hypothetical protein
MTRLRAAEGMGARALEFVILTAARSGEVRGATWAEIDLDAKVWTVPANRMKGNREHRVPLSPDAVALLKALPRIKDNDLAFPAPRGGGSVRHDADGRVAPHGNRTRYRTGSGPPSAIGLLIERITRTTFAKWRWRTQLVTRWRPRTGAATCSTSAAA